MINDPFLQLLLAVAFLIAVCLAAYQLFLPLAFKIIDLAFESYPFRMAICICLAVLFCFLGSIQLNDYIQEKKPELSHFFPLSFMAAGMFLFLGLRK